MKGRKEEGITLIALVITIIVLLILAGVTISLTFGENGILARAKEGKDKYAEAEQNEIDILDNLDTQFESLVNEGTINEDLNPENEPNVPKLAEGMIPVYYDNTEKVWKKAPEDNEGNMWYDYSKKKWANIVTVSDATDTEKHYRTAENGTTIPMEDITTFFVWIPRYAYSIREGTKTSNTETVSQTNSGRKKISITFLTNATDVGTDGVNYGERKDDETGIEVTKNDDGTYNYDLSEVSAGEPTPKIVHPAFRFGEKDLTGIWVAKFEASGLTEGSTGDAVGNRNTENTLEGSTKSTEKTYVRILPNEISWRDITIGNSQYQSMNMKEDKLNTYGWNSTVDSHLIKNNEWGAIAYLCYSAFGSVPMKNSNGDGVGGAWHNYHTGAGPISADDEYTWYNNGIWENGEHNYDTALGQLASTTGNVYGVYDISAGAEEYVAAYYNNGNANLSTNGNSTLIDFFESDNTLKSIYTKYWEAYEVSSEEKDNKIVVNGENLTQSDLWSTDETVKDVIYDEKRKELTQKTWENLAKKKGIGMNEVAGSWSYRGLVKTETEELLDWKTDSDTNVMNLGRTWNDDRNCIGSSSAVFMDRGGYCFNMEGCGCLHSEAIDGVELKTTGFRPALAF